MARNDGYRSYQWWFRVGERFDLPGSVKTSIKATQPGYDPQNVVDELEAALAVDAAINFVDVAYFLAPGLRPGDFGTLLAAFFDDSAWCFDVGYYVASCVKNTHEESYTMFEFNCELRPGMLSRMHRCADGLGERLLICRVPTNEAPKFLQGRPYSDPVARELLRQARDLWIVDRDLTFVDHVVNAHPS